MYAKILYNNKVYKIHLYGSMENNYFP